jgi:mxaK protein
MGLTARVRGRVRAAWALLALALVAAAIDAAHLWRLERWNGVIGAGAAASSVPGEAPPQVRFAQAAALAAGGDDEAALQRYRGLHDDPALGLAARYNGANLLMRQAIAIRAGLEPGKAIALIELAKESYRDVLRAEPQHWAARYNLERAQRLLADPDDAEPAVAEAPRNAERAATTMRGYSPGLP